MLVYEFETVDTATSGYNLFGSKGLSTGPHREIIARRAAEGWRFAGCIPTQQLAGGFIGAWDLVFEREA